MPNPASAAPAPSLTDTLCTNCGLCCDGSLFADVELASRAEASSLELLGLDIEDEGRHGVLVLPCRALEGTRCGVYALRPDCCRRFECKLLQEAGRGLVSVTRARELIADALGRRAEIQRLISSLGHSDARLPLRERCAEALANPSRKADPSQQRIR